MIFFFFYTFLITCIKIKYLGWSEIRRPICQQFGSKHLNTKLNKLYLKGVRTNFNRRYLVSTGIELAIYCCKTFLDGMSSHCYSNAKAIRFHKFELKQNVVNCAHKKNHRLDYCNRLNC